MESNYTSIEFEEDISLYPGFPFEQPLYLYVWPVLVLITFMANIIIILILLQKKMRNPTNIALTAIAITDSLTGLVTLPAYFMAYSKLDVATEGGHYEYYYDGNGTYDYNSTHFENATYEYELGNEEMMTSIYFLLTPALCEGLMITRFFLSQSFHTMSIWLTLYLGCQRCCCVKFPNKTQNVFTVKNTLVSCILIAVLSPILHVYHAMPGRHTMGNSCEWNISKERNGTIAYIWASMMLKQVVPCVLLIIVTIIFIHCLIQGTKAITSAQRARENRRVSIIVVVVMVIFLIPEVPYGCFLLYWAIVGHTGMKMDLETNREIHGTYEVMMIISFHSNFWIYTILNRRFRKLLLATVSGNLRRVARRLSSSVGHSNSRATKNVESDAMVEMAQLKPRLTIQSSGTSNQASSSLLETNLEGSS